MKKLIPVILVFVLLLASCNGKTPGDNTETTGSSTQSADEIRKASDYFPLTKNVYMKYRGEGNEYAGFETFVDYVGDDYIQIRTQNPGTTTVSVYVVGDGAVKRVYTGGEEYFRLDRTATREEDEILIKEPIKKGTSWTMKDGSERSITAVDADVRVPYGDYKALEITTQGEYSTVKDYYAPGVGLIKREFVSREGDGSPITSELEKISEGVPLVQTVRFFYPAFSNDRLLYTDEEIELYTNDDIKDAFESKMKKAPENSGLQAPVPQNAAISGVGYNSDTGVAVIDFSSEFITEMNAGASLEQLILTSVADTLGHYFGTDKAAVTIEGKAYESGHIKIEKGDYLTVDWEDVQRLNAGA